MKPIKITTTDPNTIGEHFRQQFFKMYDGNKYLGLGCYSVFDVQSDVTQLPDYTDEFNQVYKVSTKLIDVELVTMSWYWDGDGYLQFEWDGNSIYNFDCKKTAHWESGKPYRY